MEMNTFLLENSPPFHPVGFVQPGNKAEKRPEFPPKLVDKRGDIEGRVSLVNDASLYHKSSTFVASDKK